MTGGCAVTGNKTLGYHPGNTIIHHLSGTSKMLFFLIVSVSSMLTYDTRLIIFISICSLALIKISDIHWKDISFVIKFILFFSVLNILAVYVFQPSYGEILYGSKTVIIEGFGRFYLTLEELFYLINLCLKYFATIPLVVVFLLTTDPSEFAGSLSKIGVSYKISYAVSLALRYIPDIQEEYFSISSSQMARGYEISEKGKLRERIKGAANIVLPLILSSLDRIETISTAMELRRFGEKEKRTFYSEKPFSKLDYLTVISAFLILGMTILLSYINKGRFYNPF
ncbi:MAG: energy-coupling factor transporter transmembrane protein EcfT [Hungatella sp.]|jgi:energy-coupling factor transport system permease protein|nr:energy-coupling factor transporter transmembrane protein EcfT [Hungatella sp.]